MIAGAYAAAWLLDPFRRKDIISVIPNRADRIWNPNFDRATYRGRNLVERLAGKLMPFRRVATRYGKLDPHDLAAVRIAPVVVWLRTVDQTLEMPTFSSPAGFPAGRR